MKAAALFATLAVALMVGCASQPVELQTKPSAFGIDAVATLATNECEARTAADYTAVIVARRRAAAQLRAGKISVDQAKAVQAAADEARAALDATCATGKVDELALHVAQLARARLTQVMEAKHAD